MVFGAVATYSLTAGDAQNEGVRQATEKQIDDNKEHNRNTFVNDLKSEVVHPVQNDHIDNIDYDKIMEDILVEYNSKYGETLTLQDLSYIKPNISWLGIYEDGSYGWDYYEKTQFIDSINNNGVENANNIRDPYVIINNKENKIISSLAKVKGNIVNVDVKAVTSNKNQEYLESDKKIDLTENKNLQKIKQRYEAIEHQYEEIIERQSESER